MTMNAEPSRNGVGTGVNRRTALRSGLLAGAGLVGVTTGALSFAGPVAATLGRQDGWAWCAKCEGLFFPLNGTAGRCAAGGGHDGSTSFVYWLFTSDRNHEPDFDDVIQFRWLWCGRCQALAFIGNGELGYCPAGRRHDHGGSLNYGLLYMGDEDTDAQSNWAWCFKCQSLYYIPHKSESWCPRSGRHDTDVSFNYTLGHFG